MYISKKTATSLVGGGLTVAKLSRASSELTRTVAAIADANHNHQVDEFELAAAIKKQHLGAAAKTAMWSAMGSTATDNIDGETGFQAPVTKSQLEATIRYAKREAAQLAKNGELTVDGLAGHSVSKVTVRLISAAKAEK